MSGEENGIGEMTREEALEYMGLSPDANAFALDEKFWQLSKRYTNDRNMPEELKRQKLDELSAVFDIASGKRDQRLEEERLYESEKKFFGRTKKEWSTYLSYTWYKYLIGIVLAVVAGNLIYNIFIKPDFDCGVFVLGHFVFEDSYVEGFLTDDMGFKNPYINSVDMVVLNDEGQQEVLYSDQAAMAGFYANPNVLITDRITLPYYYSATADISAVYAQLQELLPQEKLNEIRPVYLSERECFIIASQYTALYEPDYDPSEEAQLYSDEPVMVGLMVNDEDFMRRLGLESLWQEDQGVVFCICSDSMDTVDSERIITELLLKL